MKNYLVTGILTPSCLLELSLQQEMQHAFLDFQMVFVGQITVCVEKLLTRRLLSLTTSSKMYIFTIFTCVIFQMSLRKKCSNSGKGTQPHRSYTRTGRAPAEPPPN